MSTQEIIFRIVAAASIILNLLLLGSLFDANRCLNAFYRRYRNEPRITPPVRRNKLHAFVLRLFCYPVPRVKKYINQNGGL